MPLDGQASGGWTESSSALRLLNAGIRNSLGLLTADSFSQANPGGVTTQVTTRVNTALTGVLSGSVAFARPDEGENYVGGPGAAAAQDLIAADPSLVMGYRVLGVFVNSANGNSYENLPGIASGKGPYMSGQGSYGNALYETLVQANAVGGGGPVAGVALAYVNGQALISSRNGFLMPSEQLNTAGAALASTDSIAAAAMSFVRNTDNSSTLIGVLKMAPDSVQTELVYDQRI